MKLEITYVAYDGEEFDNEKDCLEHERQLDIMKGGVQWFAEDRSIMKEPSPIDIESYAFYFRIKNAEAAKEGLAKLREMISFEPPKCELKDGQIFAYNVDTNCWDEVHEWANRINQIVEDIESEAYRHEHS